jgi:hypothetical protein
MALRPFRADIASEPHLEALRRRAESAAGRPVSTSEVLRVLLEEALAAHPVSSEELAAAAEACEERHAVTRRKQPLSADALKESDSMSPRGVHRSRKPRISSRSRPARTVAA